MQSEELETIDTVHQSTGGLSISLPFEVDILPQPSKFKIGEGGPHQVAERLAG